MIEIIVKNAVRPTVTQAVIFFCHAGHEGGAGDPLGERQDGSEHRRSSLEEAHMEELEVVFHDETGADRVRELQESAHEEGEPDEDGRGAAYGFGKGFHPRRGLMVETILRWISSGDSIAPSSPEQSIRRKRGSRDAWRRYISRTSFWKLIEASWMSEAPSR